MVAISLPWYNGSYTMAAKPIKSLELQYTMIQFLMIGYIVMLCSLLWCNNSCYPFKKNPEANEKPKK